MIEYFTGNDGKHYWRVKARNGRTVASSEGYDDARGARRGADALIRALNPPPQEDPPQ